jgi:UDP-2-acetamido-3-amino-2,3-dideoxy-glucuronate N-acetyltransferase
VPISSNNKDHNSMAHTHSDESGLLGVIEFSKIPFVPKRLFWITGVSPESIRANHAHRTCHQLLVCMSGTVTASITTTQKLEKVVVLSLGEVLHLEPLNWLQLHTFSENSVLAVLASEPYDPNEYINEMAEFFSID